jgi:glucokinase
VDVTRSRVSSYSAVAVKAYVLAPPSLRKLSMDQRFSIGVDLGGTNLRVAAYGAEGIVLDTIKLKTSLSDGRHAVVSNLCEAVSTLLVRHSATRTCVGISVGTPGPLELPSGMIRNPPNLPGWDGFNLRHAIETTLERPIAIENDANLAALAEQCIGAGRTRGSKSLCMLTMGTGVGSGLVLDGSIWHGSNGLGGEAGHIIVDPCGPPCGCGGCGCLEQYASSTAIARMMSELSRTSMTALEAAEMALSGNVAAREVFQRVGKALAIALAGLINVLNLPLHVIGGGVSASWDLFAPTMFRELQSRSYIYRLTTAGVDDTIGNENDTRICQAELASEAGLLGACLFGLHGAMGVAMPTQEVGVGI